MVWLLIVPLIVLWAFTQKAYTDATGQAPPTRGALRYQRRKARKFGVSPEDVPHNPRVRPAETGRLSPRTSKILVAANVILWGFLIACIFLPG
jgi:hypothetical protein